MSVGTPPGNPASVVHASAAPRSGLYLAILALVSFFNYMDRMLLAVIAEPLKLEMQLSDAQIGLLSGFAFSALFAIAGIPIARLADRSNRVRLLSLSIAIWSAATALTGFARSFPQLFAARMAVGLGEAGCLPASHSLIGDYLPASRRGWGVSIFQGGGILGLSAGLMLSSYLAQTWGWRTALTAIGFAGLPVALLTWFVLRNPARQTGTARPESALSAIGALLRRKGYVYLVCANAIAGFGTYGMSQWGVVYFMRTYGLTLAETGFWMGTAQAIGGVTGVFLGGAGSILLMKRDRRWELWLPAAGYAAAAVLLAAMLLSPDAIMAIALQIMAVGALGVGSGVALSALQGFAEPERRATAIAVALFSISLFGLGLGPLTIGLVSDALEPILGISSLRAALSIAVLALPISTAFFLAASRYFTTESASERPD